jgi:hypothetical protein
MYIVHGLVFYPHTKFRVHDFSYSLVVVLKVKLLTGFECFFNILKIYDINQTCLFNEDINWRKIR